MPIPTRYHIRTRAQAFTVLLALSCAASAAAQPAPYEVKGWDYPGGGSTNRLWLASAAGDFNGDGIDEMAVIKAAHSQVSILSSPADKDYDLLSVFDVDLTFNQFIGMTAGDMDGDGRDELIVLRNVPANSVQTGNILVYKFADDWTPTLVAKQQHGNGDHPWVGIAAADFNADGRSEVVAAKNSRGELLFFELVAAGNALTLRKEAFSPIGTLTSLTGVAAGDLDGNGSAEVIAVRQTTSAANKDFILVKRPLHSAATWEQFNYLGGTTHYPWRSIAVGEFDRNKANGLEFVAYKNAHSYFIYQKYQGTGVAPTLVAANDFSSSVTNPWTSIAAGNLMLNDGVDELISVRQNPGTGATPRTLAVYGDEVTSFNQKLALLQGNDGFHYGASWQETAAMRNPASGVDHDALNINALKAYIEQNHLQTFTFTITDPFVDPTTGTFQPRGTEYKAFLDFLDLLKSTGSPIKVIANLSTPAQAANPEWSATPADSPRIGAAELGAGVTDERTLFSGGPSAPSPTDYVAWFKLLGIISNKYPNLIGVGFDDFSHELGPNQPFTPKYLGKMLRALRHESERMVFIPTAYYSVLDPGKEYVRNYTDGVVFYQRNDKYSDEKALPPTVFSAHQALIEPPDLRRNDPRGKWNRHGAIVLPETDIAGGTDSLHDEIRDVYDWINNPLKLMVLGIYASHHSASNTFPSAFAVERQMVHAYASSYLDGVTTWIAQEPTSKIGIAVHNRFLMWDLHGLYDTFDTYLGGSSPLDWTVTSDANTSCKVAFAGESGGNMITFSDNNAAGSARAERTFPLMTGKFRMEFSFLQTQFGQQRFQIKNGSTVVVELQAGNAGAGTVAYLNGAQSPVPLQSIALNTWYNVQINGDLATDRMDIRVDGVVRATQVPFTSAATAVDRVSFLSGTSAASSSYKVFVDDVSMFPD